MKKKILFCIINILLVLLIGLVIGVVFKKQLFNRVVSSLAFIFFLITLLVPSVLYIFKKSSSPAINIISFLFIVFECILDIIFMSISKLGVKPFAIMQVSIIALLLISFMIVIFLFVDEKKDKMDVL